MLVWPVRVLSRLGWRGSSTFHNRTVVSWLAVVEHGDTWTRVPGTDTEVRVLANRPVALRYRPRAASILRYGVLSPCKRRQQIGTAMGTGDKIKGKLKETVGSVTGSDHLRKEGQAQQHKGHHEQKAAEARAVAEKHELQAEVFEDEEARRQGT